ncbi:putative S-locus glycoprotein [Helianthus anomalus]
MRALIRLMFFSSALFSVIPGNSKNRYLGIWFKKISPRTVLWVANRETPLTSTTGVLKVNSNGMLLLFSGYNTVIWSSNSSVSVGNAPVVAKILGSGNLVVCDDSSTDKDFVWQSFDYPTDTLLAGMKFGKDLLTSVDRYLTSWKSMDYPSPGLYVSWMDTNGYPQAFQKRGSVLQLRFGPWTCVRFSGFPSKPNPIYTYDFVFNEKEVYSIFHLISNAIMSRVYLSLEGNEMRLNWIDPAQGWMSYLVTTVDMCAQYGLCGAYGICNINSSPACSCMEMFEPRFPVQWNAGNWSGGCQHEKSLNCVENQKTSLHRNVFVQWN